MDPHGKTALVTGAAGAFGRALTAALLDAGAAVVAVDRDPEALERLRADHPAVHPVACDLADPDAVDAAVADLFAGDRPLDIVVNNAGLIRSCPLVNIMRRDERAHPVALWREVLSANLDTVFFVTRAVADHMLRHRRRGVVVNLSSVAAGGNAGQTAYAAAKAGVEALTAVWGRELGPLGIRCVAVAPGFMDTASTAAALREEALEALRREIPLRTLGEAAHVVAAVRHAIENDYLNGKVLPVDGGLVI